MAHCSYLEIAAETGLIGLLLYLGIFGVTLRELWRSRELATGPSERNQATAFLLVIVIMMATGLFLSFAFERYYETSGLFGTPEICADMVDRYRAADVNEICCLVDFGLSKHEVVTGLKYLNEVRHHASIKPEIQNTEPRDYTFAALQQSLTPEVQEAVHAE